ncbi:MAG: hypothetical protein DKM50_01550 [Candidatus Margulisiibacteriota bacterium]|nr:MAG: hypothetical protein A2X43_08260 [Candidatus Margulisbacteria bacterium GWD2_39_127]OGI03131.1 MAG: hypothetical protein A2X42_10910 [Candidatus Margulisbacteria bacterium GWF2_38_17]OGI11666.1 MAG: hypothetical protein A2X41_10280 [Candidatus Margulisbacteria bacterium GWE2_39_32]PZM83788.1 MAG: hypothetical protein DKM50_01550 [Candidatus Margulisiibacteriota bacterium]HAR63020.1 hypothetical protein [Candidatus Margulisiibacteriota bacterium]
MKKYILLTIFLTCISSIAYAEALPQRYISIRSSGMGGVGVACENGIDVLNVNPALMNQIGGHLHILSVKAEGTGSFLNSKDTQRLSDFSENLDKIGSDANKSDNQKSVDVLTELQKVTPLSLRANISVNTFPSFIASSFIPGINLFSDKMGFGGFGNAQIYAAFVNSSDPRIRLQGIVDSAGIIGFSKKINKGLIPFDMDLGVGIKMLTQQRTYNKLDGSDTIEIGLGNLVSAMGDDEFDSGRLPIGYTDASGTGYDVGLLIDMPWLKNGKMGMVFKDLSTTIKGSRIIDVSTNVKESFSDTIPMTAKIGYSGIATIDLPIPIVRELTKDFVVAFDYDIISPDKSFFKKIHMGIEKGLFSDILKIRLGNNQGNTTFGASIDLAFFHISYANFTDELGRKVGINPVTYQVVETGFYF